MQADESMKDVNRQTMMRFWEAAERGELEALAPLVHPDVVMEWPQSGERFTGRDNALGALRAQEVKPEPAGEPVVEGCGDTWVARVPLRYGDEIYHYVGVFSLDDGMIRRTTEYFGAPFPPNPARAAFTDRS